MTKRLIYLEDAIDALAKWFHDDVFGITESDGTATIFKRLRELPSAQPERKKGKWITYHYLSENWSECECDQCHKYVRVAYDFCPNCGSKMVEGKE